LLTIDQATQLENKLWDALAFAHTDTIMHLWNIAYMLLQYLQGFSQQYEISANQAEEISTQLLPYLED
jgi:hypothetical protein